MALRSASHRHAPSPSRAALVALGSLLAIACSGGDPLGGGDLTERAARAGALGERDRDENIPILLEAIRREPEEVQTECVQALGRIGTEAAVEALATLIDHESRSLRTAVAQALQDVKVESYPAAARVLVALGRRSLPRSGPADDPNVGVRRAVMTSLAVIKQPESAPFLVERLAEDYDEHCRNTAVVTLGRLAALGRLDPETRDRAFEVLVEVWQTDNEKNRSWAIESFGSLGDPRAVPYVREALTDFDEITRGKAAMALPRLLGPEAIPDLEEMVARETDDLPAVVAAGQLVLLGRSEYVQFLEDRVLKASDELARAEAAKILAEVGRRESMPALDRAYRTDRSGLVIREAANAMQKLIEKYPREEPEQTH